MTQIRLVAATWVIALVLPSAAMSANFTIINPAEKISNPADKIYNPATQMNNPANNIYNPATRMNSPNPISAPAPPAPQPAVTEVPPTAPEEQVKEQPQPKPKFRPAIPQKNYYFKSVGEYIIAAKKAFNQDDYMEFLSITEDALRRISAGTIKASKKAKQKLTKYKAFGYGLLENDEE